MEVNVAEGQFQVAVTLLGQGDREEAHGALHSCIAAEDPEWSPRAAALLGESLFDLGDLTGAERALSVAVRSGHPRWSSFARVAYGTLRARQGDIVAAEKAYRDVIAQGTDPVVVSNAWFNLGASHQQRGDVDAAVESFERTIAVGSTPFAAKAGVNLGYLLFTERGDVTGARAAFEAVMADDDPEQSELARQNLAAMDQVGSSATAVVDEYVDLAAGVDRSLDQPASRRWRIFGRSDRGFRD